MPLISPAGQAVAYTRKRDLDRRAVLRGGAAVSAALLGGLPGPARANAQPHRFKVGATEITIFSDGAMDVPVAMMLPGREPAALEALFKQAGQTFTGLRSQTNITLIKTERDLILVDAGSGPDFVPTLGKLGERMEAAGIKPETITKVVFTHAHADHLWGVIDPLSGDTAFEQAEHMMTATERDFWLRPDVETRVGDAFKGMAIGSHRRLKIIAGRIKTLRPGDEVVPGVQLVDSSGHTPGHVCVLVRSGGEQLLIGGDVLTQHVVSFAEPGWRKGADMDGDKGIATRRRILDQLASEKTQLLGYHLPWPGLGRVERAGGAFRFVPA